MEGNDDCTEEMMNAWGKQWPWQTKRMGLNNCNVDGIVEAGGLKRGKNINRVSVRRSCSSQKLGLIQTSMLTLSNVADYCLTARNSIWTIQVCHTWHGQYSKCPVVRQYRDLTTASLICAKPPGLPQAQYWQYKPMQALGLVGPQALSRVVTTIVGCIIRPTMSEQINYVQFCNVQPVLLLKHGKRAPWKQLTFRSRSWCCKISATPQVLHHLASSECMQMRVDTPLSVKHPVTAKCWSKTNHTDHHLLCMNA